MKYLILFLPLIFAFASCKSVPKPSRVMRPEAFEFTSISKELMDLSAPPEDDFFSFCNGSWVKNTSIPPTESRWGSFNELEKSNNVKLTKILSDAASNSELKGSMNQLIGAYYASFLNTAQRDSLGYQPILPLLKDIQSLTKKDFIVFRIADQHREGINSVFNYGVGQDLKNISKHITYIEQGGLGLPNRDYYFQENKKDILIAYQVHIAKCFEYIGNSKEAAAKMAENIVRFETKLADSMLTPAQLRLPELTYNKRSNKETSELFGNFDFEQYLQLTHDTVPDSLVISHCPFIAHFANLLENESLTVWKDYLQWKTLNHYMKHLDQPMAKLNFEFYGKTLRGKKEQKPLNEQAIEEITNIEIGELLGRAFVQAYFSDTAQFRVNTMVDNLLLVFRQRIQKLDWMSNTTKQEALNKLASIGRKLGFPNAWQDFTGLTINPKTYLENVRAVSRFSVKRNLDELAKSVDKQKWGMPAHMVNAYYNPLLNEIAFPAGIMQAPFFDVRAEDAVNYGRIGMVIGHEFTHGFDDMGSKFAADGSFTNWWTEDDKKAFEARTALLGETFAAFCPTEGNCVNPDLTMGENIADLGGLTMAYYAYTLTDEFKRNEIREGFTPAQRFFIAYGQLWKIKYTDAEMKNRLATDPHSPGMYRVNGPLKNCPEFFQAFSIEEGKTMRNKKEKVSKIW